MSIDDPRTFAYGVRNIVRLGVWFGCGLLLGALLGIVLSSSWLTFEFVRATDTGTYSADWVRDTYIIWGGIFGFCGALLGGISGLVVGIIRLVKRELGSAHQQVEQQALRS